MHRFRKKSDAKSNQVPDYLQSPALHDFPEQSLPELPPASNFRTSLILPDLTRRFTLLRTSSGDPVSLDDLKARFAEQRARGAENQISEEEEAMILQTLGRMRSKRTNGSGMHSIHSNVERSSTQVDTTESDYQASSERQSVLSSSTMGSGSLTSSPSGRSGKRYSNNLFGSGRFRDYSYVRSVASQRSGSTRNALSITPSEASVSIRGQIDSLRPSTPDSSAPSSSLQSSPTPVTRSAPLLAPAPYSDQSESDSEYNLTKVLDSKALKRASLALEQAIKEMEEETEDEIVMPRSAPVSRGLHKEHSRSSDDTTASESRQSSSSFEAGTAISSDKHVAPESEPQPSFVPNLPGTVSPSPRLPGYIPGMPRPMTPRDATFDTDDLSRSHSTTPRATSPLLPGYTEYSPIIPPSLPSSILRRGSNASTSRHSPRSNSPSASSPLFLPRSVNGRFTPEDSQRSDSYSSDTENGWRRPVSPLSGPAFQPMAVSSRPTTPSNVTWTTSSKTHNRNESSSSRNGSSDNGTHNDMSVQLERSKSLTKSLRGPALPDSPLLERGSSLNPFPWNQLSPSPPDNQSSSIELGSPISMHNSFRSITPTQTNTWSPTSPTFPPSTDPYPDTNGNRHSKQQNNRSTSPFVLNPVHPLVFSPIANSSRSSLESTGSSYQSWDLESKKDRTQNLFADLDPPQPSWHEISPDKSNSITPGGSHDDEWDPEDIIRRYAGLTKSDFTDIQGKLVGAANAKTAPETRERVPSLRRRRPSTSMSTHSLNSRVASPAPRAASPASPVSPLTKRSDSDTNTLKANALLNSVVDSLPSNPNAIVPDKPGPDGPRPPEQTSPSVRHRDLAQMIFGSQDETSTPKLTESPDAPVTIVYPPNAVDAMPPVSNTAVPPASQESPSPHTPQVPQHSTLQRIPGYSDHQAELERDVQRRAEAATIALRKSPSNPKMASANGSGTPVHRKKINPHQISTPRLVSASTSVDTIPLRPPSSTTQQGTSKLGSRFKKLRGTIRAKAPPIGEEIMPYPLSPPSAPSGVRHSPNSLNVPGMMSAGSTTELERFKSSVPTPPASAGPGIRGFMARFRKSRTADIDQEHSVPVTAIPSITAFAVPDRSVLRQSQSAPATKETFQSSSSTSPGDNLPPTDNGGADDAFQQLFDAAHKIGIPQGALNELLARSPSTSSRAPGWTTLSRNNSTAPTPKLPIPEEGSPDRARSPISEGRPSIDGLSQHGDDTIVRKLSVKKRPDHLRAPREGQEGGAALNTVVRRTIIVPSESRSSTFDLNILMRKNSQSGRRRGSTSVASVQSGRSVHDRVPTPPPPRSPTGRRFSNDRSSPPVPQLPASFSAQAENLLQPPMPSLEKSGSAYDSLYEMYTGESRSGSDPNGSSNTHSVYGKHDLPPSESGPALEVIEYANGETIWSIVNGLRDDDMESTYGSRTSFASEYSSRDNEGVQVFFKDHGRKVSKESNSSFLSRKKQNTSKNRPETKVFYGSSAQIGRLIENISQGMEAGSFNIMPTMPSGSHPPSFHSEGSTHWTVEERLEHMLGAMGNS